jgi:hypothetical protein
MPQISTQEFEQLPNKNVFTLFEQSTTQPYTGYHVSSSKKAFGGTCYSCS